MDDCQLCLPNIYLSFYILREGSCVFLGHLAQKKGKAFEDMETFDHALKSALLFSLLDLVRTHVEGFLCLWSIG